MKITIKSTGETITANGCPVAIWKGWTEGLIPVRVLLVKVEPTNLDDAEDFDRELSEGDQSP